MDINHQITTEAPAAEDKAKQMAEVIKELRENMEEAQNAYTNAASKHRQPGPEYQEGDLVWLRTTNVRTTRPSKKLDYRKLGPFPIIKQVNPVAFKVELSDSMRIHNVFHTSLLEPVIQNELSNRYQPPPPSR
jgi:hypothetical protein